MISACDDDDDDESICIPTTADKDSSDVWDIALAVFKNSSGAAEPKATNVTAVNEWIVVVVVVNTWLIGELDRWCSKHRM
jgi:hypothetical protein